MKLIPMHNAADEATAGCPRNVCYRLECRECDSEARKGASRAVEKQQLVAHVVVFCVAFAAEWSISTRSAATDCQAGFKCPEDDLPVDYGEIYADEKLEAKLMECPIYCIHQKDGCEWKDELRKLQGHLTTCKYDRVPCPNRCSAMLARVVIKDHMGSTCPKRKVKCNICQKAMTADKFENDHDVECDMVLVWCENKCGQRMRKRNLNHHMDNECPRRKAKCPYCSKEFQQDTLPDHYKFCARYPVACPNRCDWSSMPRDEVENHIDHACPGSVIDCPYHAVGCRFQATRSQMDAHSRTAQNTHLEILLEHVLTQRRQISQLEEFISTELMNKSGLLVWRITDHSLHSKEAKATLNYELLSTPFYSHPYGYKLQASLFLNGNGSGEGRYMSVYIRLIRGEYDNLLPWPFVHPVTFTLLDQTETDTKLHLQESFVPDPSWKHFQKPQQTDQQALGFGFPKFISHEQTKGRPYVKDNTLFIKVEVNTKNVIPV